MGYRKQDYCTVLYCTVLKKGHTGPGRGAQVKSQLMPVILALVEAEGSQSVLSGQSSQSVSFSERNPDSRNGSEEGKAPGMTLGLHACSHRHTAVQMRSLQLESWQRKVCNDSLRAC